MKVYVCYECYDNGCDVFRCVRKVVDSLDKALNWAISGDSLDLAEWRDYQTYGVA